MTPYISKSALVAEIKRIEHETNYETFTDEVLGKRHVCKGLLSFIDTLEVKEVEESNASDREIAREETIKEACEWLDNKLCCYIKAQDFTIDHARLNKDLRKHLEDEI